jgi:glyceraldehyde 3-phosphate dehydrogenase
MKKIRVGINGFGRIGRAFLKVSENRPELEVVAVNDLGDVDNLAYLLKYDTAYGHSDFEIGVKKDPAPMLLINGREVAFISEKDPAQIPWGKMNVDVVVESTGFFETYEKAKLHIAGGAKRVVISAPMKGDEVNGDGVTVLLGLNEEKLEHSVVSSNASCTTNAGSPLMAILHEAIGIEKALLNTVHGYTATQSLVDSPAKGDFRRGRAAAQNIVPSSTGAAIAVTKALPDLVGLFDGIAIRVPVVTGSLVDVTFIAKRDTSVEEVNTILKQGALNPRWSATFAVTEEPLVSSDIIGDSHASIADLAMTRVVGGNLVKVLAWYDNEMGYTHALVGHVIKAGNYIN